MRKSRQIASSLALLVILSALFFAPARAAFAQEPAGSQGRESMGQKLAKQTREAAGEDSNEQFKHSSSVRLISRITGLDLEHAYWLAMSTNFVVVAGVIFWISKKSFPTMFRNRTAMIQKQMEEARRASEDANRRLSDIESRLSRLDTDLAQMRADAEKDAVAEEQRIEAVAKNDAAKILASVEEEVSTAVRSARRELKAYAVDLAVSLAEKQIHVDPATDQNLVNQFAQQLSNPEGGPRTQ